jgi:hypothetical protein
MRTDRHDEANIAFRNFAKAPKIIKIHINIPCGQRAGSSVKLAGMDINHWALKVFMF